MKGNLVEIHNKIEQISNAKESETGGCVKYKEIFDFSLFLSF
jgi:hypothetical protein